MIVVYLPLSLLPHFSFFFPFSLFLSSLREWHNQIFEVFNHYAGRSRELPSSISYKDLTDLLYDAGILEAAEYVLFISWLC